MGIHYLPREERVGASVIEEVISTDITVDGEMEFVAAAAPPLYVTMDGPGEDGIDFVNALGSRWFLPGDNIVISEIWVNIPYGFGQGAGTLLLGPRYSLDGGGTFAIPEFGGSSGTESFLQMPGVGCHLAFVGDGLFLKVPTSATGIRFKLALFSMALNVAMVGLPDVLAGETVKVQVHALIRHTYIMLPGPD